MRMRVHPVVQAQHIVVHPCTLGCLPAPPPTNPPTCLFFVLVARVGHSVVSLLVSHRTFRTYPAAAPRITALHPTARCMQHSGCIACICRVFHLITSSLSFSFLSCAREGQLSGEYRYIQCLSFCLLSFFSAVLTSHGYTVMTYVSLLCAHVSACSNVTKS